MKTVGKVAIWLAGAVLILTLAATAEKGFDSYIWPYISKQVGPTDQEATNRVTRALGGSYKAWGEAGVFIWAKMPRYSLGCESNPALQALQKNQALTIASDCTATIPDGRAVLHDDGTYSIPATKIETVEILEKRYLGAERYEVRYKAKVLPSVYSVLISADADTINGYSGRVVLVFGDDPPFGLRWKLGEELERKVER